MSRKNEINMTEGPILFKLLQFSIPLIFTSLLQLLFNAADLIVVGRFSENGDACMAAVGSTGSLINLLVNLFTGLSVGTNVVASHYYGANKKNELQETVHTAILLSVISGVILTIIGVFSATSILTLMKTPDDVKKLASIYLKLYFGGITASMIYNFGSALLRAKGDTKRPLYILLTAGLLNFLLNLLFVIPFKMNVAGVGFATIISQFISALWVIILLLKEDENFKLSLKKIHINKNIFAKIVKIGIPAGFQGIMFSFSNVIIQSSVNSLGPVLIAGNSAACNLEGFVYTSMNGISQGTLTFCSQNMGAQKKDRIKKIVCYSQITVFFVGLILGFIFLASGRYLLSFYSNNLEVIEKGFFRCKIIFTTYFLCGLMDVIANAIRGIGHSLLPVIVTLLGACLLRIIWLFTIFQIPQFHTAFTIFISYPISWIITWLVELFCCINIIRKLNFNNK